jgi:tetratricopeptide (TPR) repeat protein
MPWPALVVVGLLCAALGSGGTYLVLRPALAQASAARGVTAQAARDLGNWYEDHGQWPQAVAAYTQAIAGGLDNPDIRTDLGVAYFKSSQPQKALEQYALAQHQNPQHENSLFNEGSAYAVLGDSKRAIAIWQQYLQRFPQGQHVADAKNFIAEVQAHGPDVTVKP